MKSRFTSKDFTSSSFKSTSKQKVNHILCSIWSFILCLLITTPLSSITQSTPLQDMSYSMMPYGGSQQSMQLSPYTTSWIEDPMQVMQVCSCAHSFTRFQKHHNFLPWQ